jgi:hypothetical protein
MFARFARIGVGHQIQYVLPNTTDDEIFVGSMSNDDETLDESDLGPTIESSVDNHQNRTQGDITDDEDNESDAWDDDGDEDIPISDSDDEDGGTSMTNSDDEDCSTEYHGESEDDDIPDFKF